MSFGRDVSTSCHRGWQEPWPDLGHRHPFTAPLPGQPAPRTTSTAAARRSPRRTHSATWCARRTNTAGVRRAPAHAPAGAHAGSASAGGPSRCRRCSGPTRRPKAWDLGPSFQRPDSREKHHPDDRQPKDRSEDALSGAPRETHRRRRDQPPRLGGEIRHLRAERIEDLVGRERWIAVVGHHSQDGRQGRVLIEVDLVE